MTPDFILKKAAAESRRLRASMPGHHEIPSWARQDSPLGRGTPNTEVDALFDDGTACAPNVLEKNFFRSFLDKHTIEGVSSGGS